MLDEDDQLSGAAESTEDVHERSALEGDNDEEPYDAPSAEELGRILATLNDRSELSTAHEDTTSQPRGGFDRELNEAASCLEVTCPLGQRSRPLPNRSPVPHICLGIHHGEVGDATLGGSSET